MYSEAIGWFETQQKQLVSVENALKRKNNHAGVGTRVPLYIKAL